LRTEGHFYEDHIPPFFAVKYVTIEAALVNYIVPNQLQPSMHAHDFAFMRLRLQSDLGSTMSHIDLRLPLLDFLGRVACDVCSCASQ
jgi:hypothetical protein